MGAEDDCAKHQDAGFWNRYRYLIIICSIFILILLLIIFIIFLTLHPSKPSFTLQDVKLYAFNISTTTTALTSNFQITISSRNPNPRIGIYYYKLTVYASYRNQQITLPTMIPSTYQGHKDVAVWSPYIFGTEVPMAPYIATSLAQDETAGMVLVNVKATGRVKWKVGHFVSGGYRLIVNCPAYITFGDRNNGYVVGTPGANYQFVEGCSVEI